jgi:DNA-binding NarL/FixJ family response regulator
MMPTELKDVLNSSPPCPSSPATPQGGKELSIRVLLVDDHVMLRQTLRDMLEDREYMEVVGEVSNGLEAVHAVPVSNPHVVVMDVNMPVMNGIEATKRIKADFPHTAVIGLSVQNEKESIERMRAAGVSSYLTKGSSIDMVCRAIEEAASFHGWSRV